MYMVFNRIGSELLSTGVEVQHIPFAKMERSKWYGLDPAQQK